MLAVVLGVFVTRAPSDEIEGKVFLPPAESDDISVDEIRHRQEDIVSDLGTTDELDPPPEFDVTVQVDATGKKNRLYFHIEEIHGYYVQQLTLKVWYKPGPGPVPEGRAPLLTHSINKYIKAGETLTDCAELVKFEVDLIGGSLGTDDNWHAEVSQFGRALPTNPNPLPALPQDIDRCNAPEP